MTFWVYLIHINHPCLMRAVTVLFLLGWVGIAFCIEGIDNTETSTSIDEYTTTEPQTTDSGDVIYDDERPTSTIISSSFQQSTPIPPSYHTSGASAVNVASASMTFPPPSNSAQQSTNIGNVVRKKSLFSAVPVSNFAMALVISVMCFGLIITSAE